MSSDDLKSRALALRAVGNTPKQIARMLGIPRAQALALVHAGAPPRPDRAAAPDQPLVGSWISRQWSNGLTITDQPADWIDDTDQPLPAIGAGLASILVVREHNATELAACGYLVDTYCQGVKNAVPPTIINRRDLSAFVADFFTAYDTPPLTAPITLAQDLVLGAVDYARTLGLDPHPDFYQARAHLGTWQPPSRITFGHNGKPHFQQGPYDDPTRIIRTLNRTVGTGNYHYTVTISDNPQ